MIKFAENLNKMIAAGLGGALEAPRTEVAVGHRVVYMEASGAVVNFETNMIAPMKNLRVTMKPIQEGSGDPSPENIRPITGRDMVTVYRSGADMSNPQSVTVQLGQTVYGGTVDVVSGVLTVDTAMVNLGDANWIYQSANLRFYSDFVKPNIEQSTMVWQTPAICSAYKVIIWSTSDNKFISISNDGRLFLKDTAYTASAALKASLNGVQLCYKLAKPLTITLTPEQLTTLKGDNNVWSDADSVSVDYPYYEETEGY